MPEFDDAWYEEWKRRLGESGGNIILALGLRPLEESELQTTMTLVRFTGPFNLLGVPAISVPCGFWASTA